MLKSSWLAALALATTAFLAVPATAQGVGSKMPPTVIEGLSQTGAKSYDDFLGRAVVIEFFAYW